MGQHLLEFNIAYYISHIIRIIQFTCNERAKVKPPLSHRMFSMGMVFVNSVMYTDRSYHRCNRCHVWRESNVNCYNVKCTLVHLTDTYSDPWRIGPYFDESLTSHILKYSRLLCRIQYYNKIVKHIYVYLLYTNMIYIYIYISWPDICK